MGDSVRPGRDEAEECMVEFLGGSREDVEAVADCKAAGPGGVGADFFFFVLEGALGLEDGLLAAEGALARAPRLEPSLVARGAATGGSIAPETLILGLENSTVRHLLELPELEIFSTTAMFCSAFIRLRSSSPTLKPDPSLHNVLQVLPETIVIQSHHRNYVSSLVPCVNYYGRCKRNPGSRGSTLAAAYLWQG